MYQISINKTALNVYAIGAQSDFYYGTMSEFLISDDAKTYRDSAPAFTKLFVVEGAVFYINTKPQLQVFDSSANEIDLSGFEPGGGDEARIQSLLEHIMPTFKADSSSLDMQVFHFGITSAASYCTDCWTNKGCRINSCKKYCNWDAGYKCCNKENGTNTSCN